MPPEKEYPNRTDSLRLLIAVPCLNEEENLPGVIDSLPRVLSGFDRVEILVVDDGSTDRTAEIAKNKGVFLISHITNRGVGEAFRTAVDYAIAQRYDVLVNIDGDGQFDPDDISRIVLPIVMRDSEIVTGSRFIPGGQAVGITFTKKFGNRMLANFISFLVGHKHYDVSCGFRAYSREALLRMNLHGSFTYTHETFLDFAAKNYAITEIPIRVKYFPDRNSRVAGNLVAYAIKSFKILARGYRDYFPLKFFWGISAILLIVGGALVSVFFALYVATGLFSGNLYLGFSGAFFLSLGILFFVVGLLADMLDRTRTNQERILYILRSSGGSIPDKEEWNYS